MTIKDILTQFRETSYTQREKGTRFERLMCSWLKTDPRYADMFESVWMWEDFVGRKDLGGSDTGIDLVARDTDGEYWAIQCKCYAENHRMDKPEVDSFLSTSGRTFTDENYISQRFSHRLWISTTNKWGSNAKEAIIGQEPEVLRVNLSHLETSPVDWDKLINGNEGKDALLPGKQPRKHQLDAISEAEKHFATSDRGKLVMACGTGKTYTSLKLVEHLVPEKGLVLFMVPSIALLGQSLNAWMADSEKPIKAICICSDAKASRKTKKDDGDDGETSVVDLAMPATTDAKSVARQLMRYRNHDGLVVVFSTYQSIDAISDAQKEALLLTKGEYGVFDFIVCDEAHRTTGVKLSGKDESNFVKIHSNDNVQGKKRLYMTATPRLYGESAKIKASKVDCVLCSMDDEAIYGKEFFRVNFSYAVQNGLLTDYKVLVLTVSENDIPANILQQVRSKAIKEINYDDTVRLIGIINGLSKKVLGDKGLTWEQDPRMMRRALAFTHKIGSEDQPGTSKNVAAIMPKVCEMYEQNLAQDQKDHIVHVKARHVDGSMGALERNDALSWLSEEAEDPKECRVITNVRCLSEGVDVPALDSVLFLSARNSQVDVVQSVGRVMRSFHKGQADEKKYGYIIIPVVVPEGVQPEDALNDNVTFSVVWDILNALRSHDDRFNALVNSLSLNKKRDDNGTVTIGGAGFDITNGIGTQSGGDGQSENDALQLNKKQVATQLELFGKTQNEIYAKLVEKCGDRLYWENWAGEVGQIARKFIERINRLINSDDAGCREYFDEFVKSLRANLNPGITENQCVEMLAQHMITRPVFEALFSDYEFVNNNSISSSMSDMIEILEDYGANKDLESLQSFYNSVKKNIGKIDNLEGKQTIIKNLYEKFFKKAFPLTVEKLGTVYTPVECVDFIIKSVDAVLKKEFDTALTNEGVHILDPFTGTGTFMTRLLQTGVIKPEDIERKYKYEIHCNEIVLLAYYIADVNIESVFQEQYHPDHYMPFNGICLTDTFQLGESEETEDLFKAFFKENAECVEAQKKAKVRVIIGNPPYSIGQKAVDDNAQNQHYLKLETKLANTYVAKSVASSTKGLYDSYIKSFRWATDRLESKEGGIVAFISNGSWIDGNSHDGMRQCLEQEFDKIYVFNLRGNQRTSGELSRREGGKIFGSGSRTPISITILVKYPEDRRTGSCEINYHDIGDYLTREQKLKIIKDFGSYDKINWDVITPNEKHDWINQRDGSFDTLLPLESDKKFTVSKNCVFIANSLGIATAKDAILYNFSLTSLKKKVSEMVDFYNIEKDNCNKNPKYEFRVDQSKITWTEAFRDYAIKGTDFTTDNKAYSTGLYRPFCKQNIIYQKVYIQRTYQQTKLKPTCDFYNLEICVSGIASSNQFSCLITDKLPDLSLVSATQCFPLYWYKEKDKLYAGTLFDNADEPEYKRMDGITDWMLKEVRSRFHGAKSLTKEDIFYYVYGLLHSEDYRTRFADDLRKSLPRIPIVSKVEDFMRFSKAGRDLAELHLNYEDYSAPECVKVVGDKQIFGEPTEEDYKYFRVPDKMRYPKKGHKDTIIYNGHITIENIPEEAYEYVVNGKSAIDWIMERYAVTQDKKSGIVNDANMWGYEHNKPRYILDLVLSIIYVSIETQKIVKSLPKLNFDTDKDAVTMDKVAENPMVGYDSKKKALKVDNSEVHIHMHNSNLTLKGNTTVDGDIVEPGGTKIVK